MSLQDLNFKLSYDSDADDVIHEFYTPALSESIVYKRLAGFFPLPSWQLLQEVWPNSFIMVEK